MPRGTRRSHLDPTLKKLILASLPPRSAAGYIARCEHWLRTKGPEWLAARQKALWNMALLERSGMPEQIPQVCRSSRIACDGSGYPKGIEGNLVKYFAKLQKPSKLRRASVALRAYTALRLDETSAAQLSKHEESICSPDPKPIDRAWVYCLVVVEPWSSTKALFHGADRGTVRFDSLAQLSGTSRYPGLLRIPGKDLQSTPYLSLVSSLLTRGWVPEPLIRALGDWLLRQDAEWFERGCCPPICGKIGVIQEGGAKARVVAMPTAWIQFYCKPYHNYLMRVIKLIESGRFLPDGRQYGMSCATMQSVGAAMALVALTESRFCAAVDLSSATDRFPLDLQLRTCSILGISEFGEALKELTGPWIGLPKSTQTRWYYGCGQPMGLYGSFPLFHLTHFLLLNSLAASLGLPADGRNFAVLGDDVIIFSEMLRQKYLEALKSLGVPVSQHKCYEGSLVEFAGFIITKCGNSATAFRPYKHDPDGNISVMNACHAVGAPIREWSPYWRRAFGEYTATLGKRDLTLEPLYSDPEDPKKGSGLPGSKWIGNVLNRTLSCYPLTAFVPSEAHVSVWCDRIARHWEAERFALLKEEELLVDIGHKGVTDPSRFDPSQYLVEDQARKGEAYAFRSFSKDPLVREYRHAQSELHRMQLDAT